jgi:hypothetical protein
VGGWSLDAETCITGVWGGVCLGGGVGSNDRLTCKQTEVMSQLAYISKELKVEGGGVWMH